MEEHEKIVDFKKHCERCKFIDLSEKEEPCWSCLNTPYYLNGVPIEFKEVKKRND